MFPMYRNCVGGERMCKLHRLKYESNFTGVIGSAQEKLTGGSTKCYYFLLLCPPCVLYHEPLLLSSVLRLAFFC